MHFSDFIIDERMMKKRINACWSLFKICEGCDMLIDVDIHVCSNCKAYRFTTDKEEVIKCALNLYKKYKHVFTNKDAVQSDDSGLNAGLDI